MIKTTSKKKYIRIRTLGTAMKRFPEDAPGRIFEPKLQSTRQTKFKLFQEVMV